LTEYYQKPLAELEMGIFLQNLQQAWKTHGWGLLTMDWTHQEQGILIIKIVNSPFAAMIPVTISRPSGHLEAGLLATWFSLLTGRDLNCIQTTSEALGADSNLFVITTTERLKEGEAWIDAGLSHDQILENLKTQL
jgi:hypothetical protein